MELQQLLPFHLIFTTKLLILISIFLTSSSYLQPVTSTKPNNFTDLEALLAFRAHADQNGILAANWTTNTSFCSWFGVFCSRRRQRVIAIKLFDHPLQGTISPYLGNLSFLSYLELSNSSLTGPIPESIGYLPRLTHIILEDNSLTGPFPSNIFNMSSLIVLGIATNNLSGSLPSNNSFAMPPRLRLISLSKNRFTGEVFLSSFLQGRDIEKIGLDENQFIGSIPTELGSLSKLTTLYLGGNRLTGTIPSTLGNLTELSGLGLNSNQFIGSIPTELGSMSKLTLLTLGWNRLTGTIPSTLSNLTKLIELELASNNLSGMIPEEIGNLVKLDFLSLAANGNLVGSIPTSLLNISMLSNFDLSENKLTGFVPGGIGKALPMLEWFNVGGNQLSGGLDFLSSLSNCNNLNYLQIYNNALEGVLPDDVGNLSTNLRYFSIFGNRIKGNIPSTLCNLSGLIELDLNNNELTGTIPSTLARLGSLQSLRLAFNNISGMVPSELGLMKNLWLLYLNDNQLFGPIPKSLASISMLEHLSLSNNKFSANIPKSLCTLSNLIELDLSKNNLNGSLPPEVSNLKDLNFLDLSMNLLSGDITGNLGVLSMLSYLNLSKNSFQGQIPESFGRLVSAISINLSYNYLSGYIPTSLGNLGYLYSLDLSFNKLEGQVPEGRVFFNSSIPSLIGNEALCGAPQLNIPSCDNLMKNSSRRKLLPLKYILVVTMLCVALLTFFCLMYAFFSRRKLESVPDTNMPLLDHYRVISHHELVRATENLSEANLLGRGGFGSVFRGCLDDGLIVAIKVLNLDVEGSSKNFEAECQVLRMVRHKNLIKIISVCSNLDFKALILEYMPNGSLEQLLYSDNYFLIINLIQRLNIMVDVSLALEYLHHHHPQVVLHCDLKPTNILLDEELSAHVSDFGIAKLLLDDSKSMATTSMLGTIGYIAPGNQTTD